MPYSLLARKSWVYKPTGKRQRSPEKRTSLRLPVQVGPLWQAPGLLRAPGSSVGRSQARGFLPVQLPCRAGPQSHGVGTAALSQTYRIFLPVWGLFLFSINGILLPLHFLPSGLWYRPLSFEL